jgi:hypothetical protein
LAWATDSFPAAHTDPSLVMVMMMVVVMVVPSRRNDHSPFAMVTVMVMMVVGVLSD